MLFWISIFKIRILNYILERLTLICLIQNTCFFVSLILDSTPRLLFGVFESGFDNEFVIKSYTMEVDSSGEWKTVMSGQTDTYTSTFDYFKWN